MFVVEFKINTADLEWARLSKHTSIDEAEAYKKRIQGLHPTVHFRIKELPPIVEKEKIHINRKETV